MIDPRKVRSYLLYATGEIALVVIGILIALQVNNWNEERANEARLNTILHEIQSDLLEDLRLAAGLLPNGVVRDSILTRALAGEITREEYAAPENSRLRWAALQYGPFYQKRTAFEKLSSYDGVVPGRYSEVAELLTDLYVRQSGLLNSRQDIFIAQIENRHEYLSRTYPWYWRLRRGQPDDAMVDYYMNSPEYRNFATRFLADQTLAQGGYVDSYRWQALGVYAAISAFLGEPVTAPEVGDGMVLPDPEGVAPFLGAYESDEGNDLEFRIRSGVLYVNGVPIRHRGGLAFELPFESKEWAEFRVDDAGAQWVYAEDADGVEIFRRPSG